MRALYLMLICVLLHATCLSQKPPINVDVLKKWPSLSSPQISNNGLYTLYILDSQPQSIQRTPDHQPDEKSTLVVIDIKKSWKLEVPGVSGSPLFSSNSQHVFFQNTNDSLGIIQTGKSSIEYIPLVQSFCISRNKGNKLFYQLKSPQKSLVIKDMSTSQERNIDSVQEYQLANDENIFLCLLNNAQKTLIVTDMTTALERRIDFVEKYQLSNDNRVLVTLTKKTANGVNQQLQWFDLTSGIGTTIWQGINAGNFIFDKSNRQLAFTSEESPGKPGKKNFGIIKSEQIIRLLWR